MEVEVLLRQTKVEDKEADAMSQESRGETKAERISVFHLVNPKLEPKWQSHFGNFIDNTSLALHKLQAKSEIL